MKNKPRSSEQINDRIAFVIKTLKYDLASFANKVGVSKAALSSVVNDKVDPSYAMIKNIASILPVNQEWLYMGNGEPWTVKDLAPHKLGAKAEIAIRDVDEDINGKVRVVRMDTGLTQSLFAGELKISRDIIAQIESYRTPAPATLLKRMCTTFRIEPRWVLIGDVDMKMKSFKKG